MWAGRTKLGIALRSTQGMKNSATAEQWVLVADRARLCLFQRRSHTAGHTLDLQLELHHPDGKKKGRDLVTDRPGRSFDSYQRCRHGQTGPSRHAYGEAHEPERQVAATWAKTAAETLRDLGLQEHNVQLTVFAESRFLGLLRTAVVEVLPLAAVRFHVRNFGWLETPALRDRIEELLARGGERRAEIA